MHAPGVRGRFFFFFNDTATTEIYTLSLHDALPISSLAKVDLLGARIGDDFGARSFDDGDRKSTRLNSSHLVISYAVFCLKKKNTPTLTSSSTRTLVRDLAPRMRTDSLSTHDSSPAS